MVGGGCDDRNGGGRRASDLLERLGGGRRCQGAGEGDNQGRGTNREGSSGVQSKNGREQQKA